MRYSLLCVVLIAVCVVPWQSALADKPQPKPPLVEKYLIAGELAQGEVALTEHLRRNPQDDEARFGLGTLQFIRGIERLMQSFHQYGLRSQFDSIPFVPFVRLPVPANADPQPVSYLKLRQVYLNLLADLTRAEATLESVKDDNVKLRLHFGRFKLDMNGDGVIGADESLWKVYAQIMGGRRATATREAADQFEIAFDNADVHWLRGYCHLLMALDEFILAHDWKQQFDTTGHLLFPKVESPYSYLKNDKVKDERYGSGIFGSPTRIADFIAFIHLINFPVKEPERMKSVLKHLETVVALSRVTWKSIAAETDDDREWIPSSTQSGVLPGIRVTKQMIDGWKDFLDEAEAILSGKTLVPHWRVDDDRGINLRRVFTEPRRFDLVLWIQGSGIEPYLEKGTVTKRQTWQRLQTIFRGQFFGFAVWFN